MCVYRGAFVSHFNANSTGRPPAQGSGDEQKGPSALCWLSTSSSVYLKLLLLIVHTGRNIEASKSELTGWLCRSTGPEGHGATTLSQDKK